VTEDIASESANLPDNLASNDTNPAPGTDKSPALAQVTTAPADDNPANGAAPKATQQSTLPVRMLFDRLLVAPEVDSAERRTSEGLVIPATAVGPKRLAWANVVAKGENVRLVKLGDRVLFDPEDRAEVDIGGANYVLLREKDIHGVTKVADDAGTGLYL